MTFHASLLYGVSASAISAHLGDPPAPDPGSVVFHTFQNDATTGTTWTFSGINIGAAASSDRIICVMAFARAGGSTSGEPALSATFNSNPVAEVLSIGGDAAGIARGMATWILEDASIETLSVQVDSSQSLDVCFIAVYTLYGVLPTPFQKNQSLGGGPSILNDLIANVPAGSVTVGLAQHRTTSGSGLISCGSLESASETTPLVASGRSEFPYTLGNFAWTALTKDGEAVAGTFANSHTFNHVVFAPPNVTTFIQMVNELRSLSAGISLTLPFNTTPGNWLVVMMYVHSGTAPDANSADGWTRLAFDDDPDGTPVSVALFYKQVQGGDSPNTISPQVTANYTGSVAVYELEVPGGDFGSRIEEVICLEVVGTTYDPPGIADYGPVTVLQSAHFRDTLGTLDFGNEITWYWEVDGATSGRKSKGAWSIYGGGAVDPSFSLTNNNAGFQRLVLSLGTSVTFEDSLPPDPPASPLAEFEFTIPSGTVSSDLSDFPVYVDLSDMPSAFWDDVTDDGGDIRVRDGSNDLVPVDIVFVDTGTNTGAMFFKAASVLAASDNTWTIEIDGASQMLPHGDTNGRYAVWSDYETVLLMSGNLADRTGNHALSVGVGGLSYEKITMGAGGGLDVTANTRLEMENQLAGGTVFTMAATGSFAILSGSVNYVLLTLAQSVGGSTDRCAIGLQNATDNVSTWDATNSWLDGGAMSVDVVHRFHGVWNGATEKKIYVDGAHTATDGSVSAIGSANDSLMIADNGFGSAYHRGKVGYVYVRYEVLSDAWIAAEYDNVNDPDTFYTVSLIP